MSADSQIRRRTSGGSAMLVAAVGLCLAAWSSAQAVEINVDFGVADGEIGVNPNDVQAGFFDYSLPADVVMDPWDLVWQLQTEVSRNISGVTVSVESDGGTFDSRTFFDTEEVAGSQGDLLEDGFLGFFKIRLADLPPGTYELSTFHYFNALNVVSGIVPIVIYLDTGSGESLVVDDVEPQFLGDVATASLQLTANGSDDVTLRFGGGNWINGLTLVPVPEPASWLLMVLGIGALLGVAWARTRPVGQALRA